MGDAPFDQAGFCVSAAGDVNGRAGDNTGAGELAEVHVARLHRVGLVATATDRRDNCHHRAERGDCGHDGCGDHGLATRGTWRMTPSISPGLNTQSSETPLSRE